MPIASQIEGSNLAMSIREHVYHQWYGRGDCHLGRRLGRKMIEIKVENEFDRC